MTQRSGLFALFFVLFAPTNGFTQEEGEETLPEECPIWERYTLPEATLTPVIMEGAFTIPAKLAADCIDGEGAFTITVEDDDGPIPGRVNLYQRESLYALAWAPPDGAERRPSVAKNARATVRLYTTFSRLTNAPTEAFEERTFTLDVATTPTPDPTPPMVSGARPQLSIEDIWPGSDSLCHRAEIILRWTNPEQPPGTGAFASVTVTDAHPEGTTSNNRTGPEGAITRNYTAYAEQYCLTPAVERRWIDDRRGDAAEICFDHADFVALLGDGKRLCYGPSDTSGDGASTDDGAGGARASDPSTGGGNDSGCAVTDGSSQGVGWLATLLCLALTRRRRA